jgi:hypothetical protein
MAMGFRTSVVVLGFLASVSGCSSPALEDAGATLESEIDGGAADADAGTSADGGTTLDAGRPAAAFQGVACGPAPVDCTTATADVCSALLALQVGEAFDVGFTVSSGWLSGTFTGVFTRGVAGSTSRSGTDGDGKVNTAVVRYDGECALWASANYCCKSTNSKNVSVSITSVAYCAPSLDGG